MSGERTDGTSMVVLSAPATRKAAADWFTGDVWVDGITDGAAPGSARLATVRFSPGARTAWHRHAYGQTLHVTDGCGLVRSTDGQTLVMRPGETVVTPPGVWQWHGRGCSRDDLVELLATAGEMDRNRRRDRQIGRRPMIAVMAKTGLRVTELCQR